MISVGVDTPSLPVTDSICLVTRKTPFFRLFNPLNRTLQQERWMTVSVTDAESQKRQVNPLPILYCSLDNMKEQSTTGVLSLPLPNLVANPIVNSWYC